MHKVFTLFAIYLSLSAAEEICADPGCGEEETPSGLQLLQHSLKAVSTKGGTTLDMLKQSATIATEGGQDALASLCPGTNSWLNPATGETGACIAAMANGVATTPYSYHGPWESAGSVSAYGCDAITYDCANQILLVAYYNSGPAQEWGDAAKAYVVKCIEHQCSMGPDPGRGCAPHGRGAFGDICATMFPDVISVSGPV